MSTEPQFDQLWQTSAEIASQQIHNVSVEERNLNRYAPFLREGLDYLTRITEGKFVALPAWRVDRDHLLIDTNVPNADSVEWGDGCRFANKLVLDVTINSIRIYSVNAAQPNLPIDQEDLKVLRGEFRGFQKGETIKFFHDQIPDTRVRGALTYLYEMATLAIGREKKLAPVHVFPSVTS